MGSARPGRGMRLGILHREILVECEILPDAIRRGPSGTVDGDGVWTGSVVEHERKYHFFYTGHRLEDGLSYQRICHATSDDMIRWTKDASNPVVSPDPQQYETVDWRDPFVFWNDSTGCYTMLIAAREIAGPPQKRGCLAVAQSKELRSWELVEAIWTRPLTHCMECPEVFQLGDYWYLVFSRYSEHAQTSYRVAKSIDGPWEYRQHDSIEDRRFYAARSASDGTRRVTFAWAHDRTNHGENAPWEWGGRFASPRELVSLPDGTLVTRLPPEVVASYSRPVEFGFEGK